uniref:FAR1 domain-containing protein n=1 Tax=Lactuca sativa TaxID=4236 RepID=A0A9R1WGZ5_LACSA|nr:hypothetical protein LSAT_V11C200059220 [Lactuca sativa]
MGDQVPDVNNHIYHKYYLASDDENGNEDFNVSYNDTLYNDEFQIGESSNPNLEDANHEEDENQFLDEDIEVNIDFSEDNYMLHMITFPGGTLYWTPIVSDDFTLKVTSKFDSYGKAVTMYRNYALESGFDVKLGRVKKRKAGLLHIDIWYAIGKDNQTQRRKDLFRRNCKAEVVLDIILGTLKYVVSDFVKQHNHDLFSKGNMYLSRSKRKLDYSLYSVLQVGPSIRGGLVSDFKNVRRNLNCYIGRRDAKFLVDKMNDRKKNVPSFTFEYKVLNKRLNSLFWVDETTKNDMVFVPFTGIDNHKKCVAFGAGLLSKEDGVSYEWLLRAF